MEVEIAGRKVDLSRALPLQVRDWKALSKAGFTWTRFADAINDPEAAAAYALHVLRKADPSIPEDAVDNLSMNGLIEILNAINEQQRTEQVDGPLSTGSTSSSAPAGQ